MAAEDIDDSGSRNRHTLSKKQKQVASTISEDIFLLRTQLEGVAHSAQMSALPAKLFWKRFHRNAQWCVS